MLSILYILNWRQRFGLEWIWSNMVRLVLLGLKAKNTIHYHPERKREPRGREAERERQRSETEHYLVASWCEIKSSENQLVYELYEKKGYESSTSLISSFQIGYAFVLYCFTLVILVSSNSLLFIFLCCTLNLGFSSFEFLMH